ncbi:uncharacterized protein LACBIDRAFT_330668 [Laccaria bicolor S238N-H82]|uniref:Predicted protein n=1 Tax=Laccaria bicolor (strain S238N-H82 / ATCC MYA-4686) TaxID=486041 RepID=B0DM27_LACBS|nr:uncharacterized protein LACBIDRAFT_330668 [Laccaria bicolor S238N-H82]EDR04492.1 predicted protein [Laccaria bicolor S238N-H82]|eukprot:XP_001885011.1 predicted protein [Laccaria bicolor S238N-H82]
MDFGRFRGGAIRPENNNNKYFFLTQHVLARYNTPIPVLETACTSGRNLHPEGVMCSNFGHSRSWIQLVRSFPLTPYGELAVSSEYTSYTDDRRKINTTPPQNDWTDDRVVRQRIDSSWIHHSSPLASIYDLRTRVQQNLTLHATLATFQDGDDGLARDGDQLDVRGWRLTGEGRTIRRKSCLDIGQEDPLECKNRFLRPRNNVEKPLTFVWNDTKVWTASTPSARRRGSSSTPSSSPPSTSPSTFPPSRPHSQEAFSRDWGHRELFFPACMRTFRLSFIAPDPSSFSPTQPGQDTYVKASASARDLRLGLTMTPTPLVTPTTRPATRSWAQNISPEHEISHHHGVRSVVRLLRVLVLRQTNLSPPDSSTSLAHPATQNTAGAASNPHGVHPPALVASHAQSGPAALPSAPLPYLNWLVQVASLSASESESSSGSAIHPSIPRLFTVSYLPSVMYAFLSHTLGAERDWVVHSEIYVALMDVIKHLASSSNGGVSGVVKEPVRRVEESCGVQAWMWDWGEVVWVQPAYFEVWRVVCTLSRSQLDRSNVQRWFNVQPSTFHLGSQPAASFKLRFASSEAAGSNEHILAERPRGKSDLARISSSSSFVLVFAIAVHGLIDILDFKFIYVTIDVRYCWHHGHAGNCDIVVNSFSGRRKLLDWSSWILGHESEAACVGLTFGAVYTCANGNVLLVAIYGNRKPHSTTPPPSIKKATLLKLGLPNESVLED